MATNKQQQQQQAKKVETAATETETNVETQDVVKQEGTADAEEQQAVVQTEAPATEEEKPAASPASPFRTAEPQQVVTAEGGKVDLFRGLLEEYVREAAPNQEVAVAKKATAKLMRAIRIMATTYSGDTLKEAFTLLLAAVAKGKDDVFSPALLHRFTPQVAQSPAEMDRFVLFMRMVYVAATNRANLHKVVEVEYVLSKFENGAFASQVASYLK